MAGSVDREQTIQSALSRRPEMSQAAAGVDAFRLEVCAQQKVRFRQTVSTLAAGSDLHSRPVPMPNRNGDYKPGAVPPEMPTLLVGKREDRVARAAEYSQRQEDVYEKTLGLVRLEAINAYLNYEATTERLREAKQKFDNGRKLVEESRVAAATRQDPELLLRNEALAGKAQAEYLEAAFEHLKALATLERVTAGGVRPAFPGR
jgi:outer membrane protein TolC